MNKKSLPNTRVIRPDTGNELTAKYWETEAPLRMLMNNLHPDVAERPEELVVYGGIGRAARNWEAYDNIVKSLRELELDETLLIQSGKPVGVFKTHKNAPRVLLANGNLVPHWATWEHFNELDKKGLMMYGQMTAGSWIYIGSQGIIQGTYETFVEMGRQHFEGDLTRRLIVAGGLGGMGGAQPLAATMAGANAIIVECQAQKIDFRIRTGYLDAKAESYEQAMEMIETANEQGKPLAVGLLGNVADVFEYLVEKSITPDIVTDQTSAHDPAHGYLPQGWDVDEWETQQERDPKLVATKAKKSMARQVDAMNTLQRRGAIVMEYGNNLRQMAQDAGCENAFGFPGFVEAYVRPLFCKGKGPFRWVALSGDPEDIYKTDEKVKEIMAHDNALLNWLDKAREHIKFQGLPARICWVGLGFRDKIAQAFNEMVRTGELSAPIVIGRDHMDSGSVASPNRETEGMKDGSDAVSDWPILNMMLNCSVGATWVSFHHGGGLGMGFSQHSGIAVLADGSEDAHDKLGRVFWNDPATGVMRHADAGYDIAINCAKKYDLNLPSIKWSV